MRTGSAATTMTPTSGLDTARGGVRDEIGSMIERALLAQDTPGPSL
jgi:hypothetical protein